MVLTHEEEGLLLPSISPCASMLFLTELRKAIPYMASVPATIPHDQTIQRL